MLARMPGPWLARSVAGCTSHPTSHSTLHSALHPITRPLTRALAAWPSQCELCRDWGRSLLCRECLGAHVPARARCRRCGLAVGQPESLCGACLRDPPPFERTVCALDYVFPWDRLIGHLKFQRRLDLAAPLAALLGDALAAADAAFAAPAGPAAQDTAQARTVLVPVPLSEDRLAERGFNQAWELARRMARARRLPVAPRALARVFDTPAQAGLTRADRQRNLRNAFAPGPQAAAVRGCDVALVDDVMTTGATAVQASATLLRAGARSVQLWVLARTPEPRQVT